MTVADRSYAAGFLDGEGCFFIGSSITLKCSHTHYAILKWLQGMFGGTIAEHNCKTHKKQAWVWAVHGQSAYEAITRIRPFLKENSKMNAELIDFMGSDLSVVNAARVSFDKESGYHIETFDSQEKAEAYLKTVEGGEIEEGWQGHAVSHLSTPDARLIRYLAKHDHWTPFAHTSISLRMRAPVPIRTQCFKHKAGLVENEESRRYISSTPELYVPEVWRKAPDGSAKQGSGGQHPYDFSAYYERVAGECIEAYEYMIEEGVCPEQARFVLPQGCLVNWIWTGNLYSFANFFKKRTDSHAQKEIQELAQAVGEIIEPLFPVSWAALTRND